MFVTDNVNYLKWFHNNQKQVNYSNVPNRLADNICVVCKQGLQIIIWTEAAYAGTWESCRACWKITCGPRCMAGITLVTRYSYRIVAQPILILPCVHS